MMDTKIHRYMQRIEKIIHTPTKSISPIRPSKSPLKCRTNQLDHYLKYELSVKIISNFINKRQQHLLSLFFNYLRKTQYRSKQRIFKFVAIEKRQLKVDLSVAAKIMGGSLKQIFKDRFTIFVKNLSLLSYICKSANNVVDDQPFLKKRQDTLKSAVLIRSSSRPQASNYRQISEWNFQGSNYQAKDDSKQLQQMKRYILKTLLLIVLRNLKMTKKQFFKKIQIYTLKQEKNRLQLRDKTPNKQLEAWKKKEQQYLKIIQKLQKQSEINISRLQKNNTKSQKIQQIGGSFWKEKKKQLLFIIKTSASSYIQQHQSNFQINQHKKNNQKISIQYAFAHIQKVYLCFLRRKFSFIFHHGQRYKQKIYERSISIAKLIHFFKIKQIQSLSSGFSQIVQFQTGQRQKLKLEEIKTIQIKNSSMPDFGEVSSNPFEALSNNSNPILKLNFYSFVNKIFKIVLIVSKLLIPIKQAFIRIDHYASYSYKIQESFKVTYIKTLRQTFDHLKIHSKKQNKIKQEKEPTKNQLAEQIVQLLSKRVREQYIEPFSFLKILSRQKDLKIKIYPVRPSIVDETRNFIQQRNIYGIYSLDFWSKVKENNFQEPKNPQKQYNPKKRSNTAF